MSTERMAEIAGRMKAATEGPWKCFYKSKYDEWHVSVPTDGPMNWALFDDGIRTDHPKEDAEFIAHARTDIPWLHAELTAALERERVLQRERDHQAALRSAAPALQQDAEAVRKALDAIKAVFAKHIAIEQIDVGGTTVPGYPDDIAAKYGEHLGEIEELLDTASTALASHTAAVTAAVREEMAGICDAEEKACLARVIDCEAKGFFEEMSMNQASAGTAKNLAAAIRATAPK